MNNKQTLEEALNWLKDKLSENGNHSATFVEHTENYDEEFDEFEFTEGSYERKIDSFQFDLEGNVTVRINSKNLNSTTGTKRNSKSRYSFNIKNIDKVNLYRSKGNDIQTFDKEVVSLNLKSWNDEKIFSLYEESSFSYKGDVPTSEPNSEMTNLISLPLFLDEDLIESVKKQFEFVIENFGDTRQKN